MKTVSISYPQISINSKHIQITNEQYEELTGSATDEEKAQFIWNNMSEVERNHTTGKKQIVSFVDLDVCGIKSAGMEEEENAKN